jgi:hypothetical protein
LLPLVALMALCLAPGTASAGDTTPYPNDDFADAIVIAPSILPYLSELGDDNSASTEPGEADASCFGTGFSIWYRIKLPTTRYLRADTVGSLNSDLSVWTGPAVDDLTEVACRDEEAREPSYPLVWKAKAGVTYRIRLSVLNVATLRVREVAPPSNDGIAKARTIGSLPYSHLTSTVNASRDASDPVPACGRKGGTTWYRFTPKTSGVFRGSPTALTPMVCNDDTSQRGRGRQSNVTWRASAGKTYYLMLSGNPGLDDELILRVRKATPPANDAFASATILTVGGARESMETRSATLEPGETVPSFCGTAGSATVWFRFVATSELTTVDVGGSDYRVLLVARTGGTLAGSTITDCISEQGLPDWGGRYILATTPGTTYRLQIAGLGGDTGRLRIKVES